MEAAKNKLEMPYEGSQKLKKNKLQQRIKRKTAAYKSAQAHKRRMAAQSRKANR